MGGTTSLALDSNGHRALIFNIKSKNLKTFFGLLQGIALIGGGMIINLISSIPLLCMLLRVRQLSSIIFILIDIHPNHTHFFKNSTCSSVMSAITDWLWLPSVRFSHIQQTWIWERLYDSCMPSYNIRMPCVRSISSTSILTFSSYSFYF